MDIDSEIGDLLREDAPTQEAPEQEPEQVVEETTEVEASTGVEESAEADEGSPPEPTEESTKPPENFVPTAALADERAKRQELQHQLDAMRRIENLERQNAPATEEAKPTDFYDDPDKWLAEQMEAADRRIQETDRRIQETEIRANQRFLKLAENAAKARHEDYDEKAAVFVQAAQRNPSLAAEMMEAADPAEFAYTAGANLSKLSEAGDLTSLIERERAIARAEAIAEMEGKTPAKKTADIPESLSKITGTNEKDSFEPPSATDLFG